MNLAIELKERDAQLRGIAVVQQIEAVVQTVHAAELHRVRAPIECGRDSASVAAAGVRSVDQRQTADRLPLQKAARRNERRGQGRRAAASTIILADDVGLRRAAIAPEPQRRLSERIRDRSRLADQEAGACRHFHDGLHRRLERQRQHVFDLGRRKTAHGVRWGDEVTDLAGVAGIIEADILHGRAGQDDGGRRGRGFHEGMRRGAVDIGKQEIVGFRAGGDRCHRRAPSPGQNRRRRRRSARIETLATHDRADDHLARRQGSSLSHRRSDIASHQQRDDSEEAMTDAHWLKLDSRRPPALTYLKQAGMKIGPSAPSGRAPGRRR